MVNRRQVVYALIATLVVVLCGTSLIGVEFSLISEKFNSFKGYHKRASPGGGEDAVATEDSAVKQQDKGDEERTLKILRTADSGSQAKASSSVQPRANDTHSASPEAPSKDAQPNADDGQEHQALTPQVTNTANKANAAVASKPASTTAHESALDTQMPAPGDQVVSSSTAQGSLVDDAATLDEQALSPGEQDASNSTGSNQGSTVNAVDAPDEGTADEPTAEADANEPTSEEQHSDEYDLDELMTAELIAQIESQENDCLSPMHVHLLWIGDINKAPQSRHKYTDMGYSLTVHTSAEEILEGFHPYVLEAYKLAVPNVVGYDFLKFAMLYKFGGLSADADTKPTIMASQVQWPADCDVVFGKELRNDNWRKPVFLDKGHGAYDMNRPFQILNWAMAVNKPRNPHIKELMKGAMMHFFGRRDMEQTLIQDISGSGLMSDYVALLHEKGGRSYPDVYRDESRYYPVQGMCLTDGYLHGKWIHHDFLNSWRQGVH
ncbi:hypothetical protein Gpo141_00012320 [Globisporangium polare]